MLTLCTSTVLFSFLIWMGTILMYLETAAYWLIPCFFFLMLFMRNFYHEANCHSLEYRDFIISAILSILFLIVLDAQAVPFHFYVFWYLYLATFLSLILYANSIRFKSLM